LHISVINDSSCCVFSVKAPLMGAGGLRDLGLRRAQYLVLKG
jgi:hypothetical protein